jgi:serine/threonine protein kinase
MGEVYKAERRSPLKQTVAIKIIKLGLDSKEIVARFDAERQALARIEHPNVARAIDAGVTESGRPYFVMEYVPGVPITKFADDNKLSIKDRLLLFMQACDAITHAHTKAIIHRDIKPSNVLAFLHDGKPTVKVIDFGIAKALSGDRLTDATYNTEQGFVVGTYDSMSPEQADGSPDIDTRTDVYSLGVLLYELLSGFKPFDQKTLAQAADQEIKRIIREVEPPRPSTRISHLADRGTELAALRQSRADALERELRSELEWIPLKAIRKERSRRYTSPIQLAEDIQNYLHGRPLIAGPESRSYLLRKFLYRNRGPVAAVAAVLLVLVAGIIVSTYALIGQRRARAEADRQRIAAQREEQEAKRQAATAAAVIEFQSSMLEAADPARSLKDKVTVLDTMQAALKQIDQGKLKGQPLVEATVLESIGGTLRILGRQSEAEPLLRRSLDLRRNNLPEDHKEIGQILNQLGMLIHAQGRLTAAEPLYRQALAIQRKALAPDDPYLAGTLNNLGLLRSHLGDNAEAEVLHREALAIRRKSLPPDDPAIALSLKQLSYLLPAGAEAEALDREALAICRRSLPAGHPEIADSLNALSGTLRAEGKLDQAEPLVREALEIARKVLPPGHPQLALGMRNYAQILQDLRRLSEAESMFRETLALRQKALWPGHPYVALSMHDLAQVLQEEGKLDEADQLYSDALASARKILPPGHFMIATGVRSLGMLRRAQGRLPEAEALLREALDIRRKVYAADDPIVAGTCAELGLILIEQKKYADAEPLVREALSIRGKKFGPTSAPTTRSVGALADILEHTARAEEATRLRQEYKLATQAAAATKPL